MLIRFTDRTIPFQGDRKAARRYIRRLGISATQGTYIDQPPTYSFNFDFPLSKKVPKTSISTQFLQPPTEPLPYSFSTTQEYICRIIKDLEVLHPEIIIRSTSFHGGKKTYCRTRSNTAVSNLRFGHETMQYIWEKGYREYKTVRYVWHEANLDLTQLTGFDALKALALHEFAHAIQFSQGLYGRGSIHNASYCSILAQLIQKHWNTL